jgi:putative addiction module component (TIGR02574 family)
MVQSVQELLDSVLSLPETDRADIAARLMESLDAAEDAGAAAAWDAEILRRIEELDRGDVRPIPWSEAREMMMGAKDVPPAG